MLADHTRFGFVSRVDAEQYMDTLIANILRSFHEIKDIFSPSLALLLSERLRITSHWLAPDKAS